MSQYGQNNFIFYGYEKLILLYKIYLYKMYIFHCMIIYISYNVHLRYMKGAWKVYERYMKGTYMVCTRSALCQGMVKIILSFIVFEN